MTTKYFQIICTALLWATSLAVGAVSIEDSNDCPISTSNFCERSGSCSIQGADWYQYVTVDKSEIFDTQGWPGLCDMVHVALVQGNCSPPKAQVNVIAHLSETTFANIPVISGPLACEAEIVADGDVAPLGASDGNVNTGDLLIMISIVLGITSPDASTLAHGDIYPDGAPDGTIDMSDLILMYKLVTAP